MPTSVYSRTLQKAAEVAGGQKRLARLLRVPLAELEKWIGDKDEPPMAIFLKAVDVVLDDTTSPGASEPGDPPAPRESQAPSPVSGGESY